MARTSTSTRNRTSSNRSTTRNNATTRTAQTRSSPRRPRKINAKIGHMNNIDLPPLNMSTGGHYVYIRKKRGKVSVHTITSIESLTPDRKHTIPIVVNNRTGETRYISEKNLINVKLKGEKTMSKKIIKCEFCNFISCSVSEFKLNKGSYICLSCSKKIKDKPIFKQLALF